MFAKIAYPQSTIIFRQDMQRAARRCWRRWCERARPWDHESSFVQFHTYKYLIKLLSTQSALLRCKQEIDIKKWNFSFFLFFLIYFFVVVVGGWCVARASSLLCLHSCCRCCGDAIVLYKIFIFNLSLPSLSSRLFFFHFSQLVWFWTSLNAIEA